MIQVRSVPRFPLPFHWHSVHMPCAPWAQSTEVVPAWRRSSQGRWGQARLQRCADWPLLTLFRSHTRPLGRDLEARNWSLFVCLCVLNAKGVALSGPTRSRPLEFGTVSSVDQENYKYRFRTHIVIHPLYYTLQSERCRHSLKSINILFSFATTDRTQTLSLNFLSI